MNKSVIVTGATSYIAVALIERLIKSEYTVYAVIRPNSANRLRIPQDIRIKLIELDMADIGRLPELGLPHCCALYHFAWSGVRGEQRQDALLQEKNLYQTKKVISAACEMGIPNFIGIGSQAEYGITSNRISEDMELKPVTEYGRKKAQAYHFGMEITEKAPITFIWARIFSVYGEGDDKSTLLMQCMDKMRRNEPISLSPCEHLWDYTYVTDVAEALFLLLDKKAVSGAYNVSFGEAQKLKDFVLQIKKITGSDSVLHFGAIPYGSLPTVQMDPDVNKLKDSTGWKPEIAFEDGIRQIIKRTVQNEKD